jgi:intracellular multiplication protein IcmV
MERLQLTEDDIQKSGQHYLIYTIVFVIVAAIAFATGFYLLIIHGTIAGWILAFASTAVLLANAFRFHFYHFQIKHRILGCTFNEWWRGKPDENKETG